MTTKLISFAILGFGNIGTRHAKHIRANPATNLLAICDIDANKLPASNAPKLQLSTDYQAVLQNPAVQVVNVCTPNYLHTPMTIEALKAGKHVVCEKPMALSSADCTAMIQTAQQYDRQLFVVKQNRYNPPVAAVKQLIDKGQLGQIYQLSINCFWNRNADYYLKSTWRGKKREDGGCLFTQCSHFIDIMYYLVGDVTCVKGLIHNFNHQQLAEFEDAGTFILRSKNGALINFNFSNCSYQKNMEGSITILAEKGTIKIGGQYLNTIDYQCIENHTIENLPTGNSCNDYGTYKGSMSNHDKVIQNVVDTLAGRDEVATNGENGKKVISIIENMYQAAQTF